VTLNIQDLLQVPASAADPSVRDYTEGGLLEVSGYLANIGHTIDEWAAPGGTITLASAVVITAPQSTLNVAGGAVTVQGGEVAQSYLIGADGQLYNANTAPANIEYVGVYNGFSVTSTRFGVTDTYTNPLADPAQIYEQGYIYGRDAGSVVVIRTRIARTPSHCPARSRSAASITRSPPTAAPRRLTPCSMPRSASPPPPRPKPTASLPPAWCRTR
jgi:hypothetical protein